MEKYNDEFPFINFGSFTNNKNLLEKIENLFKINKKHFEYCEKMPDKEFSKWDYRFLDLAKLVSSWSKDPSTKCGAVIVDKDRRVVSVGYNGFAKDVKDDKERYEDRETKYKLVVHAEVNAILFGKDVKGCILYTYPFLPCSNCAGIVIQSGIIRCVAPKLSGCREERWGKSLELTKQSFKEAFIKWDELDYDNQTSV